MKKKIIAPERTGVSPGNCHGHIITILISLLWADGYYAPCVPELVRVMGNEIKAVILQALLCGVLGAGFAASSVIWEIDHWSIVKQTGVYFLIVSVIMMPIAYFTYWMEHSIRGVLSYFGIFVLIFTVIWIIQFAAGKHTVKKTNEKIQAENRDGKL